MSIYYVPIDNIAGNSGSGEQDEYKTLASIIVPDTADIQVAIKEIDIGPASDSAADENFILAVERIDGPTTEGTKTAITAANINRPHTDLPDPDWSAAKNYTVEPTVFETNPLWLMGQNDRGGFFKRWEDIREAPQARKNQIICVCIACTAATPSANSWAGTITVEDRF